MAGFCKRSNEPSGSINAKNVTENRLASQEGLYSMVSVSKYFSKATTEREYKYHSKISKYLKLGRH